MSVIKLPKQVKFTDLLELEVSQILKGRYPNQEIKIWQVFFDQNGIILQIEKIGTVSIPWPIMMTSDALTNLEINPQNIKGWRK